MVIKRQYCNLFSDSIKLYRIKYSISEFFQIKRKPTKPKFGRAGVLILGITNQMFACDKKMKT
jgi:hypothetical protein